MRTGEIAELIGKEKSNVSKLLVKLFNEGILKNPAYGTYELAEQDKEVNPEKRKMHLKPVDLFNNSQSSQSG